MNGAAAFGLAIGLGACLLFQIQFLLAKLILPWFGGSPSVWSTSLVVFQVLLLAGYAYAHAIAALPRRAQALRHGTLIAIVLVLLAWRAAAWPSPVTPGDGWKPHPDASPVTQILLLLTGAIGLPFLLLASTSPLLQRWYADRYPDRSPYRLYALSNLGSLAGLVSYPWLVEPHLDVFQQGRWWTAGYVVYALATITCLRAMRGVDDAHGASTRRRSRPRWRRRTPAATLRTSADTRRPDHLAPARRGACRTAAGDDDEDHAGRRGRAVPVDGAAGHLPAHVHRRLRAAAAVQARVADARRGARHRCRAPGVEHAASRWPPPSPCSPPSAGASTANSPRARQRRRG